MFAWLRKLFGMPAREAPRDLILRLLSDGYEWTGLELIDTSDGVLKRGTVYVHLNALEEQGLIQSRPFGPRFGSHGVRRRVYKIITAGGEPTDRPKLPTVSCLLFPALFSLLPSGRPFTKLPAERRAGAA